MPILSNQQSRFIGGRRNVDWWLASGTIALANVLEHVENPAARQLYAGAGATGAWSVSLRTNLASVSSDSKYIFDIQSGRVVVGTETSGVNGIYVGSWQNIGLFATGNHTYMIVSDGSAIQCYRDNSAVGGALSSAVDIGGTVRYGSRWGDLTGNWFDWPVAVRAGHVANVALDATQRAALHTAMMALA